MCPVQIEQQVMELLAPGGLWCSQRSLVPCDGEIWEVLGGLG